MRIATSSVMLVVVVAATLCRTGAAQQPPVVKAPAASAPTPGTPAAIEPSTLAKAVKPPVGAKMSPTVLAALELWRKAAKSTPKLVSLMKDAQAKEPQTPTQELKARLQVLGDKTFSNREWRHYWQQQAQSTGKLAEAARGADSPKTWIEDLQAWQALANDKIKNQDAYLTAIERERDAIEERLESLLEREEKKSDVKSEPIIEEPTPFQVRQRTLRDLRRRAEQQSTKKQQSSSALKLIEGQLEVEKILLKALDKDVALAIREQSIATKATTRSGLPWADVWNDIKTRGAGKVAALKREARFEAARERGRRVEAGLIRSQIQFRDDRVAQIQRNIDRVTSVSAWTNAVADTATQWLLKRAWRIAIGLLLVYLLARFALSLIGRTADEWRRKAEGDPDDTKDDDQRTLTLIAVFSGVLRIAVYVIAGLLALEQIGVDTGPLLGSVAILGLAVSFGSQNLVRDVVNGLFVLLEDQYAVGDVVEISGKTGTVERITIRSTWIRQSTGDLHAVPNGSITTVTNMTRDWSRAVVKVGVGYDADLKKVEEVCGKVSEEMFNDEQWQSALLEAPLWGGVVELGDSAVVIRVLVKTQAGDQWGVGRELNQRLKVAFDEAGVDIPYPQRVVWTKSAD